MKKAFDSSPGTSNPLFKTVNKELISSIKVPFAGDKEIMIHNIEGCNYYQVEQFPKYLS